MPSSRAELYPSLDGGGQTAVPNHPYYTANTGYGGTTENEEDRIDLSNNETFDFDDRTSAQEIVEDASEHTNDDDDDDGNDVDDEDDEDIAIEGVPFGGFGLAEQNAASDEDESDEEEETAASLAMKLPILGGTLDSEISSVPEHAENSKERGRGRGRGRGRTRRGGRPRGFGLGPGSQGGVVRTRGGPRGRPRGSRAKGPPRGEGEKGGRKGKRGPRPIAEPSQEFRAAQVKATASFLEGRHEEAAAYARDAIQSNPEIFAAHSLLSQILLEMGRKEESLAVLWSGAHTKREVGVWWEVANRTAELGGDDKETITNQLMYCYSQILRLDTNDFDARKGRLGIYMEQNFHGKSVRECTAMLKLRPNDLDSLQLLAELCIRGGEPNRARKAYEAAIAFFQRDQLYGDAGSFTLSDLNIYLELFVHAKAWHDGLVALKDVARWLCGRLGDTMWRGYDRDDREWDLDDEPRRTEVPGFRKGLFGPDAYGDGLPPEIRAKFGVFRLNHGPDHYAEAIRHFDIFDPEDRSPDATVFDYADLFRDIADNLYNHALHTEALRFYKAVVETQQSLDVNASVKMGKAYLEQGQLDEAVECFRRAVEEDSNKIEARVELAKVYEKQGLSALAFEQIGHVMKLGRSDALRQAKLINQRSRDMTSSALLAASAKKAAAASAQLETSQNERAGNHEEEDEEDGDDPSFVPAVGGAVTKKAVRKRYKRASAAESRKVAQKIRADNLRSFFEQMQNLRPAMRDGDEQATVDWMAAAGQMVQEFRTNKIFFPTDRYVRFLGYSAEARKRALKMKPKDEQSEVDQMADRLKSSLNPAQSVEEPDKDEFIPQDFQGISFDDWLDVFCELAVCHARAENGDAAYDLLEAASNANIFYHIERRLFHVHVCWFTCAVILEDEEKLCSTARWFIKQFPQSTDTFRLFAALNRLYHGESSWYSAGPTQKFVLRQIKAIDFALLRDDQRATFPFTSLERTSYRHLAVNNQLPDDSPAKIHSLDPALLTMYGNILASGGSYQNALNYYLRAYAAQPTNTLTLLSIALAYLQHALKRQSENRHYHILQGLAFLREYQRVRLEEAEGLCPRLRAIREMEVEFNEGRTWHQLGLMHLAVPAYERCLAVEVEAVAGAAESHGMYDVVGDSAPWAGASDGEDVAEPDFKMEAAYALQNILAVGGDMKAARALGEKWLVF